MDEDQQQQDSLYCLLREVQLEHFYNAIKAIDVTKIEHFENVVFKDLTGPEVGMGPPAARRLLEAARKRNNKWRKGLLNIILPSKIKDGKDGSNVEKSFPNSRFYGPTEPIYDTTTGLTCLISDKDIKLSDKIGDGSFGVVMKAQWTQANHKGVKPVAVKILKQEVLLRALEDFAKEVNAMHQLRHPNLIRLYGIVLSSPMMMVTELAEQGSLRTKLVKTLGGIALSALVSYSIQIANGMDYLESKRLIHRDLATRNIFITEANTIKIGDFGLMRSVAEDEDYYTMNDNMKIPFPWCAIESLKYRQFSHASDTWMFGVTLWEIFTFGNEPWSGFNGQQIVKKLEQNERLPQPKAAPHRIYQAMEQCWRADPMNRPTFSALIKFLRSSKPIRLRASTDFDSGLARYANFITNSVGNDFLKVTTGDEIEVIDGKPENYWWRGQSQRTYDIGLFPRSISKDRQLSDHRDISHPLKNSFIHTGHMDVLGKKSWGNPEFIEKMYLEHPVEPHDIVGHSTTEKAVQLETRGGRKSNVEMVTNQIDKILSIDELNGGANGNGFEDDGAKEDILIDFSDSFVLDESNNNSNSNNNANKARDIMQNELASINFATPPPPPPPLPQYSPETDFSTIPTVVFKDDANNVDHTKVAESLLSNYSPSFDDGGSNKTSDVYIPPDDITNVLKLGGSTYGQDTTFSKHYAPPLDSVEPAETFLKASGNNRYYSSVATNCDAYSAAGGFNPYGPAAFSTISAASCIFYDDQTEEDFAEEYSNHLITNMPCPLPSCTEAFYNSHQPITMLPTLSMCGNNLSAATTTTTLYNPNGTLSHFPSPLPEETAEIPKVTYQSQRCQDLIHELEENIGKIKGSTEPGHTSQQASKSAHPFPIINPPPKSTKVRRPAPPPPVKKSDH